MLNRFGKNYRGKNHGNFITTLLITLTKKEEDMNIQIELISESELADESFNIVINGLKPRETYRVEMYLTDYYCINAPMLLAHDVLWRSTGTFVSDKNGIIDISQTPSCSGSYEGISTMGLFFNAKPLTNQRKKLPNSLSEIPILDHFFVDIKIMQGNTVIAERTFTRHYMSSQISHQDIYGEHFRGRLFYDKKVIKTPALIIVSGSEGRIEKAQNIAQLLSSRGYICLAFAYFGLEGLPKHLERIPLESLVEAKNYLRQHPQVDSEKIGIYGRSKGAEFVLAEESLFNDVQCLVLNSPSDVIYEGIKGKWNSHTSSWTYLQKGLPYQKFQLRDYLFSKLFRKPIPKDYSARIDISRLSSPILLLGSTVDEIWDASSAIDDIVSDYKGRHITFKKYHETGHMLTVAYQPNHRYRKDWRLLMRESKDSWLATIHFFDRHLKKK